MNKKILVGILFGFVCTCFAANATLKYSVTPKVISSAGVESTLDNFTITGVANTFSEYKATISTGTANTTLPTIVSTKIVEFQATYPVTLGIWTAGGVFVTSHTSCYNYLSNSSDNYVYKVTIASTATTANIIWRQGK